MNKLNILLTNDDGINAIGLKTLVNILTKYANIYIAAPKDAMSGASHSFCLNKEFEANKVPYENTICAYQINSTPVDCVRLGTYLYKDIDFDIVISGINNGLNVGTDIIYSGTVAAAREAHIESYASIAISCDVNSFKTYQNDLDEVIEYIIKNELYSKEYLLNINLPSNKFKSSKGIRWAHQGIKIFDTSFQNTKDEFHISISEEITLDKDLNSDVYLSENGYTTLVPLKLDQTNYDILNKLKK